MRVTSVTIRRNRSMSHNRFEHEHLELEVELAEGDTVDEAVGRARATIRKLFGEAPSEDEVATLRARLAEAEAETL